MLQFQLFERRMGSDTQRDRVFLELVEVPTGETVAEVVYSDKTREFSISLDGNDLPLEKVEGLISSARLRLVPAPAR